MKTQLYTDLVDNLNQLVRVYRHLLDTVRKEKQILVRAQIIELTENNKTKEKMVQKVRELEQAWMESADQLYKYFKLSPDQQSLVGIALQYEGESADRLRKLHSVLSLLVSRTTAINKENDVFIQSALTHISGAMKSIKKTLNKNSNYEKQGKRGDASIETSGRLVSKEA